MRLQNGFIQLIKIKNLKKLDETNQIMISQLQNQKPKSDTSTRQMLKNLPVVLKEQRSVLTIGGSLAIALMLVRRGRHIMIPLWGDNLGLDITETTLVFGISFLT